MEIWDQGRVVRVGFNGEHQKLIRAIWGDFKNARQKSIINSTRFLRKQINELALKKKLLLRPREKDNRMAHDVGSWASSILAPSCSSCPINIISLVWWMHVIFCGLLIPSYLIMREGIWVSKALGRANTFINICPFYENMNYFWSSSLIRIQKEKKNHFPQINGPVSFNWGFLYLF